jgi:hypothetical protein
MGKRLFSISILLLAISGCSYNVPLMHELVMENPPEAKYNEKILVVMSKEQAQKVINYSPQVGDTYVFNGGPALKSLIISILGQIYNEVSYVESLDMAKSNYDRAIEVVLQSHEITMNIYTGNSVKLEIDYAIYNQKGELIDKLPTNSSSKERYSGSNYVNTVLFGSFYNIGKMKQKTGAAWDTAAVNSIGKLIDKLAEQ